MFVYDLQGTRLDYHVPLRPGSVEINLPLNPDPVQRTRKYPGSCVRARGLTVWPNRAQ